MNVDGEFSIKVSREDDDLVAELLATGAGRHKDWFLENKERIEARRVKRVRRSGTLERAGLRARLRLV